MTSLYQSYYLNIYKYNEEVHPKLLKICSEFLHFLKLNYFCYGFYSNGSHFSIMTNLEFRKNNIEQKLNSVNSKIVQDQIVKIPPHQTRAFIISGNPKDPLEQLVFNFNIWNSLVFMHRKEDKVYWWTFGTDIDNTGILSDYINKRTLFESFIKYFNHAAVELISGSEKNKVIHPDYKVPSYDPSSDEASQQLQVSLLKDTNSYANKEMYLTKREIECINYLSQGKTAKEIANLLELSHRTVEAYLQNARLRLKCPSKSRLIDFFKYYYGSANF